MHISLLTESQARRERRVALDPRGVRALARAGHAVHVERGAGAAAGFPDPAYEDAGATIVHRRHEALARGRLVLSLGWLAPGDIARLRDDAVVVNLTRLDLAPADVRAATRDAGVTCVSADRLRDPAGRAPVRERMSELAGALAPQLAGRLLQSTGPGRHGVLLAALPGLPPPEVVVIGAGTLGANAARRFAALGLSVHLLDVHLDQLEALFPSLPPNVFTAVASPDRIATMAAFANVLVVAVRDGGTRAPVVVPDAVVRAMRPGAALLDFSIDRGGGAETSRPMSDPDEAYTVHGVLHLSMPNTPSLVARTATRRLSHALLPFVHQLADGAAPRAHPTFAPAVWWGEEVA